MWRIPASCDCLRMPLILLMILSHKFRLHKHRGGREGAKSGWRKKSSCSQVSLAGLYFIDFIQLTRSFSALKNNTHQRQVYNVQYNSGPIHVSVSGVETHNSYTVGSQVYLEVVDNRGEELRCGGSVLSPRY